MSAWKNAGFNGSAYIELTWYDSASNSLGTDALDITSTLETNTPRTFTLPWRYAPENSARVRARVRHGPKVQRARRVELRIHDRFHVEQVRHSRF